MINQKLSNKYKKKIVNLIQEIDSEKINELAKLILKKKKNKKKIYIFGNGGSASTANHFAVDMTKNAKVNVDSFSNDDLITCFSNDYGYENWIANVLRYQAEKNDLAIFLSVSGNSLNLVNGIKYCKKNSIDTYSLTGRNNDNKLNKLSDNYFWINSKSYNQVEIVHHMFLLTIVDVIIGRDVYTTDI
jgi:D-sedoheptulose 7-phosphate isomerase